MFSQSKIFSTLLSGRASCPKCLYWDNIVKYSSAADRFEPRTDALKRRVQPLKYEQEKRGKSLFFWENYFSMADIAKSLQVPFDFRSEKIASWVHKQQYSLQVKVQQFKPERLSELGRDLSAAHGLLSIGVGLQFKGKPFLKLDKKRKTTMLPKEYEDGWLIELIDMSDCPVLYEGLLNIRRLNSVHTLIAQRCCYLDDWCLDIITSELLGLEVLDLSGCQQISPRGLISITRLPNLRTLELNDCPAVTTDDGVLVCLMLLELNPKLSIKGVEFPDFNATSSTEQVLHPH